MAIDFSTTHLYIMSPTAQPISLGSGPVGAMNQLVADLWKVAPQIRVLLSPTPLPEPEPTRIFNDKQRAELQAFLCACDAEAHEDDEDAAAAARATMMMTDYDLLMDALSIDPQHTYDCLLDIRN